MGQMMTSMRLGMMALAAAALPQAASAAIVTYTNEAAFLAAISAPGTDSFNDLSLLFMTSPLSRSAGSYGYTAGATNGFYAGGTTPDLWLGTNMAHDPIVLGSFTGNVYGLGGLFFTTDNLGAAKIGNITVSVTSGAVTASRTLTETSIGSFVGFVSATPLDQATITAQQPLLGFTWPTINNLTLGGASVAAVPEPATWAMMIVGLGAIGASLRRRAGSVGARFVPAP